MERRTKEQIIKEIIKLLKKNKEISINEIAIKIKANWLTINNALEFLKELKIVEETITTPKIRLFKLIKK